MLQLLGDIDAAGITLDIDGIEALGLGELAIFEPFEAVDATFAGVPLSRLLDAVGHDGDAAVHLHALDDYEVTMSEEDIRASEAFLATRRDGAPLAVADGGPTRIIFPEDSEIGRNSALWIWSIDTITVE